jgi:hypothetical protein
MNTLSRRVTSVLAAVSVLTLLGSGTALAGRPGVPLFQQTTPGTYTWNVPKGVKRVTFELYGAAGGSPSGTSGGLGGKATATFAVQPGQAFQIVVGGQGGDTGAAGSNGGGTGETETTNVSGGGGGATDVRGGSCVATTSCGFADRFLVAGGGGGGAYLYDVGYAGGSGGGSVGGDGQCDPLSEYPATGGTLSSGGSGAGHAETLGTFGVGGSTPAPGGGGGGGWFGGGGGWLSSGGGGSGYISGSALSGSMLTGVRAGNGMVVIWKA